MNKIALPRGARQIIQRLSTHGYSAYVVGGCVRDSLIGMPPKDWDICTSALPEEVKGCFPDIRIIETGLKHGTVTLVMGDDQYEVTTFRIDGEYSDNRRPDSVEFVTDVTLDLARRDFTINAIAYNNVEGFIDPYGGAQDIANKRLRCAGNAVDRFNEDGLRIMRALRFASTYGFAIDTDTAIAIHDCADLLNNIAAERINTELCRLLKGSNVLNVLLEYPDIIATIIPEIAPCIGFDQNNKYHVYTIYDHIAHAVANYHGDDTCTKVALLLHDIGKPQCYSEDENGGHFYGHGVPSCTLATEVVQRLKFDKQSQKDITELVLYHDAVIEPTKRVVKRWLNRVGELQFMRLMDIRLADIQAHTPGTQESRIQRRDETVLMARQIIAENQCFSLKDLAIGGEDIMTSFGIPQCQRVGQLLKAALNAVIDGVVENDRDTIINYLLQNYHIEVNDNGKC